MRPQQSTRPRLTVPTPAKLRTFAPPCRNEALTEEGYWIKGTLENGLLGSSNPQANPQRPGDESWG